MTLSCAKVLGDYILSRSFHGLGDDLFKASSGIQGFCACFISIYVWTCHIKTWRIYSSIQQLETLVTLHDYLCHHVLFYHICFFLHFCTLKAMLRHLWDTFGVLLKLFLRLRHTFEVEALLNPFWNLCDAPLKCCWCLFMPFFWCWCAFDILLKPCWFPFDWKIVLMLTIWNPFESMIEAFLRPFWSTFWCQFETRLKLRHLWNHLMTLLMPFWGWSVFETIWNLCKCWDTFELVLKPFWNPFEVETPLKPFNDTFNALLRLKRFWNHLKSV